MATKVHMEALSPTMEEGQLVRWLKNEGDTIAEGDILAEIETDKATMELVARGSGVLRSRMINEGQTAPVGTVIGVIAGADEDVSALTGGAPGKAKAKGDKTSSTQKADQLEEVDDAETEDEEDATDEAPEKPAKKPEEKPVSRKPRQGSAAVAVAERGKTEQPREASMEHGEAQEDADEEPGGPASKVAAAAAGEAAVEGEASDEGEAANDGEAADDGEPADEEEAADSEASERASKAGETGRVKASPLARRMAAESGVELSSVAGSGPGGRVIRRDVEGAGAAEPKAAAAAAKQAQPTAAKPPAAGQVEEIPVSQMRKTIAKRLVTSIGPVPTFYLTIEVDMSRMIDARERVNERLAEKGSKASINDFVIKAVAAALRQHPEINAAWHDTVIRRYGNVHIGVAVAVAEGLITPIVRDADTKGVAQISAEVRELAGRAKEKKLKPEEYTGATFSISNLGMFGIDEFTAIINPPEAAILAVGRVEEKVVAENGMPVVQPRMRLTMSCDHRVIDGAMGAKFLQTLRAYLEEPINMLA